MTDRAWAFCLTFNEETMIGYWTKHYKTFCERVVVYVDSETTDRTREIAMSYGADVREYFGSGHMDDIAFIQFAQHHYREARGQADWVVWTDADEFVYHPRLVDRLAEFRDEGTNFPVTVGYSMLADAPPSGPGQIYEQITRGIEATEYAKVAIFDPILDVNWITGKHAAEVHGPAKRDDGSDPLRLLHYRWLGAQWFAERNARNFSRLNDINRKAQHGRETYPGYFGKFSPEWYNGQLELAKVCV